MVAALAEAAGCEWDEVRVAWGGVLAQLMIALPLLVISALWRSLPEVFEPVVIVLGYINLLAAAFNLLPAPGLDGALAWRAVRDAVGTVAESSGSGVGVEANKVGTGKVKVSGGLQECRVERLLARIVAESFFSASAGLWPCHATNCHERYRSLLC